MADKPTLSRTLQAVAAVTLAAAAVQTGCEHLHAKELHWPAHFALAGVCAVALVLIWVWRRPVLALLRSIHLAVALLTVFALGCVLATLTVQETDASGQGGHESYLAFRRAEANMLWAIGHAFRKPKPSLSDAGAQYLAVVEKKFGADYARRERRRIIAAAKAEIQTQQTKAFAERWNTFFRLLYRVTCLLHLNRAYTSWWLVLLLTLVPVNLVFCTARRYPYRVRDVGFLAIHLGVLVALAGSLIGTLFERRGMLPFVLGQAQVAREFIDQKSGRKIALGFDARVRGFQTVYHRELHVGFMDDEANSLPDDRAVQRTFKVRKGWEAELEGGKTVLRVEDFLPSAQLVPGGAREGGDVNPAAAVEVRGPSGALACSDWLYAFSRDGSYYADPKRRFTIHYVWQSHADAKGLRELLNADTWGVLTAQVESTGERRCFPCATGRAVTVGPYSIAVEESFLGVKITEGKPQDTGRPDNPAVVVNVRKGDTSERRWVFDRFDFDSMHKPKLGDLKLSLDFQRYRAWRGGASVVVLLTQVGSDPPALAFADGSEISEPGPIVYDTPIALSSSGLRLTVSKSLLKSRETYEVVPSAHSTADASPAILLRATGPTFDDRQWLVADSVQSVYAKPGGVAVVYKNNTNKKPMDWYTHLEVVRDGRVMKGGTVEVNHPLVYRGWRFYQTDADPARPKYTGIQVVKDPGWPLAKAGLLMLLIGVCYVFFVQPILRRKGE